MARMARARSAIMRAPASMSGSPSSLSAPIQHHRELREDEIRDQNRDRNGHDRARRALAHTLGATPRPKAEMAPDDRHDESKHRRLEHAREEIGHLNDLE